MTFVWLLIGIYLEAVAPREYGKPLKPWFIFQPSFWCPKKQVAKEAKPAVKHHNRSAVYLRNNLDESDLNIATGVNDLQKE